MSKCLWLQVIEQQIFKMIKEHRGDDDDEARVAMNSCVCRHESRHGP